MRADPRARAGVALPEVLVAFVLVAVAGIGLITLIGQTAHTMRLIRTTERDTRRASELLSSLVLLDRASLLALRGSSPFHGWTLRVTAVSPALFDVDIAYADSPRAALSTTLYRPDSTHAGP